MQLSEKPAFFEFLHEIGELYEKKLSPATLNFYWEDLCNEKFEMIKLAVANHRRDSKRGKYMPKAADILNCLRDEKEAQKRTAQPLVKKCFIGFCENETDLTPDKAYIPNAGYQIVCRKHFLEYGVDESTKQIWREADEKMYRNMKELGMNFAEYKASLLKKLKFPDSERKCSVSGII